jgi:hypothetical protein
MDKAKRGIREKNQKEKIAAAHKPPMPITPRKIALNISRCFTQRITVIGRANCLAVFADHSSNPPTAPNTANN